jgi:prepilin-type N-terminal cleavage/methylation domain-containing protein
MRYGKLQNEMRDAGRGYGPPVSANTFPFPLPPSAFPLRRGVTLIEMLIVLFIISLLAAVTLRALPGEEQRPRESARMLSAYISLAKSQAAATGRSVGVTFSPSTTATYDRYCTLVQQCEIPPTYGGDTLGATVMAMDYTYVMDPSNTDKVSYCFDARPVIKLLIPRSEFPNNLIRYGDKIQIGGMGPIYTICFDSGAQLYTAPPSAPSPYTGTPIPFTTKNPSYTSPPYDVPPDPLVSGGTWPDDYNFPIDASGYITSASAGDSQAPYEAIWTGNYCLTCYLDPRDQQPLPWPKPLNGANAFIGNATPVSFTIIRQAVKSATAPMSLPAGAGVDMAFSGVDNAYPPMTNDPAFFMGTPRPVTVLFSPNGSVELLNIGGRVYYPTQPIHLLLGKLTVSLEPDKNWFDLNNYILSINPQTGTVSTNTVYPPYCNENLTVNPLPFPPFPNEPPATPGNKFDPQNPPATSYINPYAPSADTRFLQALFYSRKYAREAQTIGGKR